MAPFFSTIQKNAKRYAHNPEYEYNWNFQIRKGKNWKEENSIWLLLLAIAVTELFLPFSLKVIEMMKSVNCPVVYSSHCRGVKRNEVSTIFQLLFIFPAIHCGLPEQTKNKPPILKSIAIHSVKWRALKCFAQHAIFFYCQFNVRCKYDTFSIWVGQNLSIIKSRPARLDFNDLFCSQSYTQTDW